jgi:hypothetical protein
VNGSARTPAVLGEYFFSHDSAAALISGGSRPADVDIVAVPRCMLTPAIGLAVRKPDTPAGISTDSARDPEMTGNNRHDSGSSDT